MAWLLGRGVDVVVEGEGELVGGEEVHAAVADEGRSGGEGVQHPLQAPVSGPAPGGAAARPGEGVGALGCMRQVDEVGAFGVVELEGAGDGFENGGGGSGEVSALQLGVVLHAHIGERGYLAAAQAGYPPAGRLRAVPPARG